MANWKLELEDFNEELKIFLDREFSDFSYDDMLEAYEQWGEIVHCSSVVMDSIESRLTELEEARLDLE